MLSRLAILFVTVASAATTLAGACRAAENPFGGAAPISSEELQSARGGFFATNGLQFGFGATLQTLVGGQVALTTTLTLQDNGSVSKVTTVNTAVLGNNVGSGGGPLSIQQVNGPTSLADALAGTNVNAGGLSADGLVIKSSTGVTALLDNVTPTQLQNLVINTASGQNIVQNTTLTVSLPPSEMAGLRTSALMNGLMNAVGR